MKNMGIGSWPARRVRTRGERTAFTFLDKTWTFNDVEQESTRIAHGLREQGIEHGDRIAYIGHNSVDLALVLFATAKLGAVFVPLNTRLVPKEVAYILNDCTPKLLVWDTPFSDVVESAEVSETGVGLVSVQPDGPSPTLDEMRQKHAGQPAIDEVVTFDDLFMLQYTSGTTGHPKGVMLTHGNVTFAAVDTVIDSDMLSHSVLLIVAPLFHTAALNKMLLTAFFKGARSVIEPTFDADRIMELLESERVTQFFGVTSMYVALMQHPRWETADLSALEQLSTGAQGMSEAMLQTLTERAGSVTNGYGLTEASPGLTILFGEDSIPKLGSVGGPHFFTSVRVVDLDGNDAAPNEVGEIIAAGPNITPGYFGNPEATAATFDSDGWLKTGDLGRFDEDGYLTIVDRVKDMIISGGENIYPAEVENAIYAHPAVAEAAVVGVPDKRWGEVGRAVVTLKPGHRLIEAELLEFLQSQIAKYKIPRSVVVVDDLPHTASGKLLKREVRELYGASAEDVR